VEIVNRQLAVYKLIQYFGSIVGMGILAIAYWFWSSEAKRDLTFHPALPSSLREAALIVMAAVALVVAYRDSVPLHEDLAMKLGEAIIGGTQAMFLGVVVVAVAVKMARWAQARR
jgi:hypothetical protein